MMRVFDRLLARRRSARGVPLAELRDLLVLAEADTRDASPDSCQTGAITVVGLKSGVNTDNIGYLAAEQSPEDVHRRHSDTRRAVSLMLHQPTGRLALAAAVAGAASVTVL